MMENLFLRVFTVSAAVSLLLLPLLLGRRGLEKRYAPETRWGIWLAVALVLLAAPWLPKPQALLVVEPPSYTLTLPAAPRAQPIKPVGEPVQPALSTGNLNQSGAPLSPGNQIQTPVPATPQSVTPEAVQIPELRRPSVSLTALAAWVWLAGMALVLLRQGSWYLLARRRLLRSAQPVNGLEHYAAELGLEGKVTFYHCKAVPGPMTLGLWKPAVLLPPEGLAVAALRHELYHVKRRDVAYKLLLLCACALHWFNPLVWLLYRAADRDVEACCDAAVVAGQDSGYKRSYGELLLTAAAEPRALPFTTSFGGEARQMKARLTQLFRPGKQSRTLVCAVLALAVALGSLVACQQTLTKDLADGVYCSPLVNITWPIGEEDAEGEDYGSIGLSLLEYSDTEGPHGKSLGDFTLPLSDDLMLRQLWWGEDQSAGEKGTEEWRRAVGSLLNWPVFRDSMPLGTDYLVATVKNGEVTRLSWAMVDRDDTLYVNEAYGFTLQLPESWGGRYVVEEESDQYGVRWVFYERDSYEAKPEEKWGCLFSIVLEGTADHTGEPLTPNAANGWGILGFRGNEVYRMVSPTDVTWLPETRESYEELEKGVAGITPENFGFIGETPALQPLTENTMPTLDYYDPEREFLLYHTLDTAYFYYGDTLVEEYHADQSKGRRVLWRCDVSRDEQTVYLSDVFDDREDREERFYAWDIDKRELKKVDAIPAGLDHMTHVSGEELFYSGFMNGTSLKSNVLKARDGTLVGLYINEQLGDTIEYLQLSRMDPNGTWAGGEPFLTPERIPSPRVYTDPDWGFSLTLPESLAGNYVVLRAANNWNFYDKALYSEGGYLFSLWAEDSAEQQRTIDSYPGEWDGKILGEQNGITYTATFWDKDMTTPMEQENGGYMARMEEVKSLAAADLDLTAVTRSSGDLWPLPYIEYGSDVVLEVVQDHRLRLLSPEGVTVQSMAAGTVEMVKVHPATVEQSVVIRHPDGRYSEYRHLEYIQVAQGDEVKRGEILGFAKEGKGKRWLLFSIYEGDSWETSKPIDPLEGREYRTYDFRPITRKDLTIAGDPQIEETLQSTLRGETPFYNVETREYQWANALPDSDGLPVKVYRFTEQDVDGDRIPELVLWLERGDDEYVLGSIVLHYRGGVVYGYPMSYRSLDLDTLKADGTFAWSSGADHWGWGRLDFPAGEIKSISWVAGTEYYVDGLSSTGEDFYRACDQWETEGDVVWYSLSEVSPGGFDQP